jgi:hypothetical protein
MTMFRIITTTAYLSIAFLFYNAWLYTYSLYYVLMLGCLVFGLCQNWVNPRYVAYINLIIGVLLLIPLHPFFFPLAWVPFALVFFSLHLLHPFRSWQFHSLVFLSLLYTYQPILHPFWLTFVFLVSFIFSVKHVWAVRILYFLFLIWLYISLPPVLSDEAQLTLGAVLNFITGQNIYTHQSFSDVPQTFLTPTLNGSYVMRFSYPPLMVVWNLPLLIVPVKIYYFVVFLVGLGICTRGKRIIQFFVSYEYECLMMILFTGSLILSLMNIGITDIFWVLPLCYAFKNFDQPKKFLLGMLLAFFTKQTTWVFLVPTLYYCYKRSQFWYVSILYGVLGFTLLYPKTLDAVFDPINALPIGASLPIFLLFTTNIWVSNLLFILGLTAISLIGIFKHSVKTMPFYFIVWLLFPRFLFNLIIWIPVFLLTLYMGTTEKNL